MADEIIRLDYSAKDIGDNIDEVRTARGTFDTLDDRLDNIEGGGPSPSDPIASNCVSPMTGYSKSSSSTPGNISTSDTLNAAIGKLEKRTELNENNILSIQTDMGVPTISNTTTLADYAGTLTKGYHTAFIVNGQNPSDSPISDNCFVDFFVYSANTAEMRVYPTYSAYAGEFYVRTKVSGSWGGWFKFQGTAVT